MKRLLPVILFLFLLTACSPNVNTVVDNAVEQGLDEKTMLDMAYLDEAKAYATYEQVLADHGEVRPFVNIIRAEETHMNYLLPIYEQRGYAVPEFAADVPSFDTVQEACQAGVTAEIENVAVYDELFTQNLAPDVYDVFAKLQAASRDKHLPAFERCS